MSRAAGGPGIDRGGAGFVLPMVILLVVVVGLTTSVMLARGAAQEREVRRQVDAYAVYHSVRGIREALDAFITSTGVEGVESVADADGHVLTLEPGDQTRVMVYLFDGQGRLFGDPERLPGVVREFGRFADREVRSSVPPTDIGRYIREDGPWQVSLATAPGPVLRALVRATVDPALVEVLEGLLAEELNTGEPLTSERLNEIMDEAELTSADKGRLSVFLTDEPTFWEMVIDIRGSGVRVGEGLIERYRAMVSFRPLNGASGRLYERPPSFVGWSRDERESGPFVGPPGPSYTALPEESGVGR